MASEHEEAVRASAEALKKLVHSCIDERMVKQGKDRLMFDANVTSKKSTPTTIEKLCVIVDNLLHYRFTQVCDLSFQIVAAMFEKLGIPAHFILRVENVFSYINLIGCFHSV